MTSLDDIRAAHPGWTIRCDAGPDWTCWTAQRAQVITAPDLNGLAAKLSHAGPADSPAVTSAAALLAEHHQPLVMTPGDLRGLLARYQRALTEVLGAIGPGTGT